MDPDGIEIERGPERAHGPARPLFEELKQYKDVLALERRGKIAACFMFRNMKQRLLSSWPDRDAGKVNEAIGVRAEHLSLPRPRGGGDDQIVRAAGATTATGVCQQRSVCLGDVDVVGLHGDRIQHTGDEGRALLPARLVRQLDADGKLRHRDRGDRHVVLVLDQPIEDLRALALGVD